MPELARKALFFAVALPVVARAALRVVWHRRHRLDEQARRLRRAEAFRLGYLRNPRYLAATVDRVLAFGRRSGRCWLRSLLLLDLWSRCGLEPRLRLGVVRSAGGPACRGPACRDRQFHAWVTFGGRLEQATSHRELWAG